MHPTILWTLRNREPLEPGEARAVRHIAFWTMFVYLQKFAYGFIAGELVIAASVAAIFCLLVPALRARTSFIAMHAALIVSMSMSAWQSHDATLIVDLCVLVVLALVAKSRTTIAALLLLHALAMILDPWCVPSSAVTSAHFVARAMAMVMCISMLFPKRVATPRAMNAPPPAAPKRPLSAAEWDRASR